METRILLVFVSLLSFTKAQCTGTLRNDTAGVSVSWNVVGSNRVEFTYSAPSNRSQFTFLAFSNNTIRLVSNTTNMTTMPLVVSLSFIFI